MTRRTNRRRVLKALAATSIAATGPWVISSSVLAAAGEVHILMWPAYLPPGFLRSFTEKTQIKVNVITIDSNQKIIAKMKASEGRGTDICSPTNLHSPDWETLGVLQPFDYSRIGNINNLNPVLLKIGDDEWNFGGDGSHWLPHVWRSEGIAWRTDRYTPPGPGEVPSYGDLWQPEVRGQTVMRPHSGMLGAGLFMARDGQLEPGAMRKAYDNEATMRRIWEEVLAFCVRNKAKSPLFWQDADEQRSALLSDTVLLGQAWESPSIAMLNEGKAIQYRAPFEGALTWVDGMALSKHAADLDAVYAFLDFCFEPESAGMPIDGGEDPAWGGHGYNSAILGADKHASAHYRQVFESVYPGDALEKLWPWPKESQWHVRVRTEYRNKFVNA